MNDIKVRYVACIICDEYSPTFTNKQDLIYHYNKKHTNEELIETLMEISFALAVYGEYA